MTISWSVAVLQGVVVGWSSPHTKDDIVNNMQTNVSNEWQMDEVTVKCSQFVIENGRTCKENGCNCFATHKIHTMV